MLLKQGEVKGGKNRFNFYVNSINNTVKKLMIMNMFPFFYRSCHVSHGSGGRVGAIDPVMFHMGVGGGRRRQGLVYGNSSISFFFTLN